MLYILQVFHISVCLLLIQSNSYYKTEYGEDVEAVENGMVQQLIALKIAPGALVELIVILLSFAIKE